MSAIVTSGVASFSIKRCSAGSHEIGTSSPYSLMRLRHLAQRGYRGSSLISQPRTIGTSRSSRSTSERRMRVLAWPRSPRIMKLCWDRMALMTWGSTESSYPTIFGKSCSEDLSFKIKLSRNSRLTGRWATWPAVTCFRRSPNLVGCIMINTESYMKWRGTPLIGPAFDRSKNK